MISKSRVTILVKASPQPSKKHSETVCCAGIDANGDWKRLFPIRFRHLSGEQIFSRWNVVEFSHSRPRDDHRRESCRVHEESIKVLGKIGARAEKTDLTESCVVESEKIAIEQGASLALIQPFDVSLSWKRKSTSQIEAERNSFIDQSAQLSMLDNEVKSYEPCPFKFTMRYQDAGGPHTKTCADWETSAAFFNLSRKMEEQKVLAHLQETYCKRYVETGLVFALGNMKSRPQTWQLLGIFPVPPSDQPNLL